MRWSRMALLAVAAFAVMACGLEPEADEATRAEPVDDLAAAAPTCQPSPDMPLEGRVSPYDSANIAVGDGAATICYGRPSLRGREMIGGEAVPYGKLWRTGANEPTIVHLNVPARIAGLPVEPGSYSLYTIPQPGDEWTLIINRSTSQWGHESRYTPEVSAQELGRAQVPAEAIEETVEQLTIRPAAERAGALLEWQNTRVFISIEPR